MSIGKLQTHPALIVIDLQTGTLSNPTVHPVTEIVTNSVTLMHAFRAKGLPVVVASVTGSPPGRTTYGGGVRKYSSEFATLVPEVNPQPSDILLTRSTWSAFTGTDLALTLTELNVTQVVLTGIATSFGVESTARSAYDLGFSVFVTTDAVTDLRPEAHDGSIGRVFPALAQTGTTEEILTALRGGNTSGG